MTEMTHGDNGEMSVGVAVALGRIEANLDSLTNLTRENAVQMKEIDTRLRAVETAVAQKPDDERFRKLETTVEALKATAPVKVQWWVIVGGLAGIGSIVLTLLNVFNYSLIPN